MKGLLQVLKIFPILHLNDVVKGSGGVEVTGAA